MPRKSRGVSLALLIVILITLFPFVTSCQSEKEENAGRLDVVVTILPQVEFVERVGGDKIDVSAMVPSGASPHTYEPKPSQLVALEKADIYFKVGSGIDFELSWLDKLLDINNEMAVVDCSEAVAFIENVNGEQNKGDPHIWMSPLNAAIMVENIYRGMITADPENENYYKTNRDTYIGSLISLDNEIRSGLEGVENRAFMVYHPSFNYFAKDYNLLMLSIEEDGKEPTPARMASLIDSAREYGIKTIFAEPQFNPQSAEVIAEAIEGSVVFIDPIAKDYLENIRLLCETLLSTME